MPADKDLPAGEDTSTIDSSTPPDEPGILLTASFVTQPAHLTDAAFNDWYENVHIGEVQATGGVPGAVRYYRVEGRAVGGGGDDGASGVNGNGLAEYKFITVYDFPSLHFRFSRQFKSLDGQSQPKGDMYERIFSKACFATRFCGLVYQSPGAGDGPLATRSPAKYAVVLTLERLEDGKRVAGAESALKALDGFVRFSAYAIRATTVLHEFKRVKGQEGITVIVEFEQEPQVQQVLDAFRTVGNIAESSLYTVNSRYGHWDSQKG